jgi:hypothetical protein
LRINVLELGVAAKPGGCPSFSPQRAIHGNVLDSPLRLVECAGLSGSPLRGMTLEKHRHVLQASGLIHHANEFGKSIGNRMPSHGIPADIAIVP